WSGCRSTLSVVPVDPGDKKPRNDKSAVSVKHEFDPTGLVQRCVIIQRDENGFGLTVSGDNPVFVQLVKEDGAAMRAGVQTGDRIIKVNGTLVTHSNHIEVVKLIKSGSYVALTVLGRPPGLPQIPLGEEEEDEEEDQKKAEEEEKEKEEEDEGSEVSPPLCLSPALPGVCGEQRSSWSSSSPQENSTSSLTDGEEECSRHPRPKLLKEIQEIKKQISLLQEQLGKEVGALLYLLFYESPGRRETPCQSPDVGRRDIVNLCSMPDSEDNTDTDCSAQCIVGSPPYLLNPQIIGAEDDYFDCQQEQINGQCSCFQSLDLLKGRPAHLAVFLHHVVSQFDPAPLLCYLYADMHKQTNAKESRRFFMEFHSLFMDRTANLKVPVPETVSAELEKRRLELIPEELCKHYTQVLQDALLPDLHKNLDDFRQKRSMGLTLAEDELSKLDVDPGREQSASEKECSFSDLQTMQYVILTYMKHLGVKVKEPRGLEHKRARINFLPKIKKSIKSEKEGEEKVKKPRFPNILVPPRRLSRVDSTSGQRSPKQSSQPALGALEQLDSSAGNSGRGRASQLSESSDTGSHLSLSATSPTHSSPTTQASDTSGQESDSSEKLEGPLTGEQQDNVFSPINAQFDFSPSNLEQLQEEDQETNKKYWFKMTSADIQSEDDQGGEVECEGEPLNWQCLVSRGVLESLTPQEIKRQEVINELFYTERAHLRTLKVMDSVFYQRLNRDGILSTEDIRHIFINLEEIVQLHVSVTEQMTAIRKRSETSVIDQIGDDLLSWFSGEEEEKIKQAVGTFCSNQPSALELIKTKKKKDQRFHLFMQEAESNRLCRRLQLKDLIPVEMQRLTKYPLLLENIARYTEDGEDKEKVKKAGECCKNILNHVNQAVKEAENKQRLEDYQRRLDLSSLKQSENPMILELKNLDLTKRIMVHEGPLLWKVNKDRKIELYALLLEDILVLLQKQDERLVLKFHGKNPASAADTKHVFSPVIKLNTVLVRPVATNNKSFFVLSMSDNGAQIYELTAQTVSDRRRWQCLITQCAEAMKAKPHNFKCIFILFKFIFHMHLEKDTTSSADIEASPSSINPFNGLKSEDEEEELTVAERQEEEEEEEEELDEAELEAFLDGKLAERLQQEESCRNQEAEGLGLGPPTSKAEEALQTCESSLYQKVYNTNFCQKVCIMGCFIWCKRDASLQTKSLSFFVHLCPPPGGFLVLDFNVGSEESSTDDDGGFAIDAGIDMRKLLSSSSQTGGTGPNLSRQLMTHLRLLQADLQHLKEVELKYNEMRQMHSDPTTDSEDNNGGLIFS
uniref:Rho guanine nucleotide exchange factor 12-like n=1 Tax=Cynoglossus semilaevis TaxID=244447 RepID=A0A3P8W7D7_CYNSE